MVSSSKTKQKAKQPAKASQPEVPEEDDHPDDDSADSDSEQRPKGINVSVVIEAAATKNMTIERYIAAHLVRTNKQVEVLGLAQLPRDEIERLAVELNPPIPFVGHCI